MESLDATRAEIAELTGALWRMAEAFQRGFSQVVDPVRYGVLRNVVARGPVRPSEIAAALAIVPSSVTRHVQALRDEGLVDTAGHPSDGRSSLVQPTDAGREWLERFERSGVEVTAGVLSGWTGAEVRTLTRLLGRLTDDWEVHGPSTRRPKRLGSGSWDPR